jgi:hypothetical protein
MVCEDVLGAMKYFGSCDESRAGARVPTHCLYPSFEPVYVGVVKFGDGFIVHDDGGAFRCAWSHGRDGAFISRCINREAVRFHLTVKDYSIIADASSLEWLASAILSVSNASAAAANQAVSHFVAATESDLLTKIYEALVGEFSIPNVTKEFAARGRSGKEYRFDFGVRKDARNTIVINAVSPHPTSIAAKYVSFADGAPDASAKFAVHDRPLDADDVSLLQQVAEIVPLKALVPGARRAMAHA